MQNKKIAPATPAGHLHYVFHRTRGKHRPRNPAHFSRGAAEGAELGNDIAEKWKSGVPRMIYMLGDIRVTGQPETAVEIAAAPGVEIKANVRKLALVVEQNALGTSRWGWHSVRSAAAHGSMRWLCSARFSIWPSSY